MEKLTKENFPRCCTKKQKQYLIDTGAGILRDFIKTRRKFSRDEFARRFIPKSNKPTEMCNNLRGKPARLILQVLKFADMIITNKYGIEWTVTYTQRYGSDCGQEHYSFEDDMKGFLISYLENWTPQQRTWDPSGTKESSFIDDNDIDKILGEHAILDSEQAYPNNDLDSINSEPGMLDPENPFEQNNDGNIYNDTAADRFDDNSLHDITVDESKQLLTTLTCIGNNSPYDDSDVNNVTPPVNINNESGKSLKKSTFPQNELLSIPNLNDQTTVSCLTPNSAGCNCCLAKKIKNVTAV